MTTLFTLSNILCVTSAASKLLYWVKFDIAENICVDDIITTIEYKRTNCEVIFNHIFEESKIVMMKLNINIKLQRTAKCQTQTLNIPASFPEKFYRRVLFIPILENGIEDYKSRFSNDKNKIIF